MRDMGIGRFGIGGLGARTLRRHL